MCHPAPKRILPQADGGSHRAPQHRRSASPVGRKPAMRHGHIATAVLAVTLLSTGTVAAAKSSRCHVEVLSSEELPYAPVGYWLLKAKLRVTYPHGPTEILTLAKNTPWQTTLRRGDTFRWDCERLRDAWAISPTPTR